MFTRQKYTCIHDNNLCVINRFLNSNIFRISIKVYKIVLELESFKDICNRRHWKTVHCFPLRSTRKSLISHPTLLPLRVAQPPASCDQTRGSPRAQETTDYASGPPRLSCYVHVLNFIYMLAFFPLGQPSCDEKKKAGARCVFKIA